MSSLFCTPALLDRLEKAMEFESSHDPIENPPEKERTTLLPVIFSSEWPMACILSVRSGTPSSETRVRVPCLAKFMRDDFIFLL
jgi:hypothetical protein